MELQDAERYFRTIDFVIFFAIFTVSVAVGGFFGYRDRNNQTTENYFFGERKLSPILVATSIAVTFISAITVIGAPSEIYLYGNVSAWHYITWTSTMLIAIVYFIPLFHRLKMTSVYEYLEKRFHRSVRLLVSILGIFTTIAYLSVAAYVPALALSTVTPLKLEWSIALTGLTCTAYTALGGMKAVIWTDLFQAFVMVGGSSVLFFRTLHVIGDYSLIAEAMQRGGRNTMSRLDIDPRIRSTVWTVMAGSFMTCSFQFLCNQMFIQRMLSCKTVNKSRLAVVLCLIPLVFLITIAFLNGMAVYAYYEGCDPLTSGMISRPDQLIPFLAIDIFKDIPGLAGLFVSAAFCGTLSTVSSGINSLSSVVLTDLVSILCPNAASKNPVFISKLLTIVFGTLTMCAGYLFSLFESDAFGNIYAILGLFSGPVVAIFMMGVFAPWINYKAALTGSSIGFACVSWVAAGAMTTSVNKTFWRPLPLSTSNCTELNDVNATAHMSVNATVTQHMTDVESDVLGRTLYATSPLLYGLIGFVTSVVATHVASFFTGFRTPTTEERSLSVSIIPCTCLPQAMRTYFKSDANGNYDDAKTEKYLSKEAMELERFVNM